MLTHSSFEWSSRHGLRSAAVDSAASATRGTELAAIWRDLRAGRARVADSFYWDDRCLLVLEPRTPPPWFQQASSARSLEILERVLLGEAQKRIALDLGLAPSTIAFLLAECLAALGLPRRVCRVPTLIVEALHAARGVASSTLVLAAGVRHDGQLFETFSASRPDVSLERLLSPAECVVTRLLIEGLSHAEIALRRRASVRTIANQLATAFQKVGVSGRSELVCALLRRERESGRV
jgi:DNA-binding NarL/FixJ family response regulator